MAIPVTRTKVIIPRRRSDLLTRQRLLDLLYELLDYKLLIIAAPAGYGKTSLLVDFAHQVELPACWYSLDTLDHDLQRFIAHFIAALAQSFPSFGNQSTAALESANSTDLDIDRLITTIVNDAYENIREHFLLVLDDYHLVNDAKDIDYFINRFVQEVDENCHIILSSRTLLTLPDMPLMVARSQVGGLSFEELAFQTEEIQTLILQNYHVVMPSKAAEELAHETEGWITGLLLSAQTMWQGMADRLRVARVSGVGLYDYLAQQVLEQQPTPVRDFLLQTSLLEEFDVELCEAVLGKNKEWPILIDAILQNNLFVLPVGDDGRWIRYHHLFRDFLQARMEQERPEIKDRILRRLGTLYTDRKEWDKAYLTYQRLDEEDSIAQLIEQAGSSLVKSGRMATMAEWIDALPEEMLSRRPGLLSLRGVAEVAGGRVEQGLEMLSKAEAALRKSGDDASLALTLVRKAVAYRFLGKYEESMKNASEALTLSDNDTELSSVRAEALRVSAASLYQIGQLNAAIENLIQALKAYNALNDEQNIAMALMELGFAYMSTGHYQQALEQYKQALNFWLESNNPVSRATLLNNLGVLHHLMGDYAQAASTFEDALGLAKQNKLSRMEAYTLCSIGDLYADLNASDAALEAYTQARDIAQKTKNSFLLFYTDLAQAALARVARKFAHAHQKVQSTQDRALSSSSSYERSMWQLASGQLSLAEGKYPEAIKHLSEAANAFDQGGQRVEAARSFLYLALAYHSNGKLEAAKTELERAFQIASGLESHHVLVVAGQEAKNLLEAVQSEPAVERSASELLNQVVRFENNIPSLRKRLRPHASTVPFAPPKLTIQTLGRASVELDGELVTVSEWQNQKRVREFFFYLLANPEGHTKEAIGLVFWPDSSPARLKLQFKNTIYRLRSALGQDVVAFDESRYWFNRDLDYEYDVEVFEENIALAQKATSSEEKIAAFQSAVELYKGSYLPEMEGTWVWPERERLWQAYADAILSLARLYLEMGNYGTTLDYCQQILAKDSCLEEAHRLAMRAYAAKGNRAAITRQFERCRQALLAEVRVPPSLQTQMLYEELSS